MAHECCLCGGACYCSGDIDDCMISKTPLACETCGCAEDHDDWRSEDDPDEDDDYFLCPLCGLCLSGGEACQDYPECCELWPDR